MDTLADLLVRRRSEVERKRKGTGFNHMHAAALVPHNRFEHILSYSENKPSGSQFWTTHAEQGAIMKLPKEKGRKPRPVDVLVIRVNKNGRLGMSRPCANCIHCMAMKAPELGYRIKHVYYSDRDGNIVRENFRLLAQDGNPHVSKFFSRTCSDSNHNCMM